MATAPRTFRVFVSSTFSDLKAEREALHHDVWPALTALCARHGARFQAIDLRWGVSEEAALDQQAMPICLDEIDRCRQVSPKPNFIILLGQRYGWRPLPVTIPVSEMEQILRGLSDDERALLVWSERQPAEQQGWYRLDENAALPLDENTVQPEYVLLPRDPDGPFADHARWALKEEELLAIVEPAARGLAIETVDRRKYGASATEQEIWRGALRVEDAPAHVHCFFREIEELPERVADEPAPDAARGFDEYRPDGSRLVATDDRSTPRERLAGLQQTLRNLFGGSVDNLHGPYTARWLLAPDAPAELLRPDVTDEELRPYLRREEPLPRLNDGTPSPISLSHLDDLCLDVFRSLAGTIVREIAAQEDVSPLLAEVRAHDAFRQQRARGFLGRDVPLHTIAADLASEGARQPLLVHGQSGSGKSALLAEALTRAWAAHGGRTDFLPDHLQLDTGLDRAVVIARFIGATPDSSDGRALLQSLCQQLAIAFQGEAAVGAVPADFNGLVTDFRERIAGAAGQVSAERPLLIFLDALDQLSEADNARSLFWLPPELPAHVHVVVSALSDPPRAADRAGADGAGRAGSGGQSAEPGAGQPTPASDCFRALAPRLNDRRLREVEPLSPGDAGKLLDQWLGEAHRTLTNRQRAAILGHGQASGLPIYLQLAFETARRWRSFTVGREIDLAGDAPGIIRQLFNRLSQDSQHGPVLVARSLALLAAARSGLAEDELLGLLSPIPDPSLDPAALQDDDRWQALLERPDWAVLRDFHRHAPHAPRVAALPVVLWSRLALDLRPYLAERAADGASLLSFYHRQLREVVERTYFDGHDGRDGRDRHAELAAYFLRQQLEIRPPEPYAASDESLPARLAQAAEAIEADVRRDREEEARQQGREPAQAERPTATDGVAAQARSNLRKLAELPYQQTLADDWDGAFATLTDFTFLEQKAATGGQSHKDADGRETTTYTGVFDLQADYQRALDRWPREAGEDDPDGPGPIIVTATDFHDGDGYRIRCPICLVRYLLEEAWLGTASVPCPGKDANGRACRGRWRVNSFTAPPRPDGSSR